MNPILKTVEFSEDGHRYKMKVEGGIQYIRGNSAPYFSLTADVRVASGGYWREDRGGCCHDLILQHAPEFSDVAALHLSDIDGAPMYALENGFYFLGGSVALGKYSEYRRPYFKVAADHFRITEEDARGLVREFFGINFSETAGFLGVQSAADAKARLAVWVDSQRPRWKAEADAAISKHGLQIYGDVAAWKAKKESKS